MDSLLLNAFLRIGHTQSFCCSHFLCVNIDDTVCIAVYLFYIDVSPLLLLCLECYFISKIFLLLFLGSSSIKNSDSCCLVSYLVILFIALAWCPICASSSHMFFVFVFGCSPLITTV
jgi:hypothetical protein